VEIACASINRTVRSGEQIASFDASALDAAGKDIVEIVLEGVEKTACSRVLRLSLSSRSSRLILAGNLYTYGEGPLEGRQLAPITLSLDVTEAVRHLPRSGPVQVCLEILDGHGQSLKDEHLFIKRFHLRNVEAE